MVLAIFLTFFLFAFVHTAVVIIKQGALNGTTLESRNGFKYEAFYQIPYAQPPTGEWRFQAPRLPPPSWEGVRDASRVPDFSTYCVQSNIFNKKGLLGREDCLYLQVYTRNIKPRKLMPVLVWIHGGAFYIGNGAQVGPQYFMDKEIVMVAINYRLGVFGFFSTGDSTVPGNYGLKDQSAALLWVQKNIQAFGGDPQKVTIQGQSAGSVSTHLHSLSPLSRDLFHQSILESGVGISTWGFNPVRTAKLRFQEFLQLTKCPDVDCLRNMPVWQLKDFDHQFSSRINIPFRPVIEPEETKGAFLIDSPVKLIYYNPYRPLLLGFNSNEMVGLNPNINLPENCTNEKIFYEILPELLEYNTTENPILVNTITSLIKKLYFGNNLANNINHDTSSVLYSDFTFRFDIVRVARNYPGTRYAYQYEYDNGGPLFGNRVASPGIGHNEELRSLFPFGPYFPQNDTGLNRRVSELVVTYWTNFIMSGNPNFPNSTLPTKWAPVRGHQGEYMHFGTKGLFEMLAGLNTLGKDVLAEYFAQIRSYEQ